VGVFELLIAIPEVRRLILEGASADALRDAAQRAGMRTLRQNAVLKVLQGVTTVEETLRVVMASEETA
jgi:type II secretory ATPase GspE/PulE/Tfp pilus assembly ATPase PilB-like protein